MEFYSIVSFDPGKTPDDRAVFSFRIGGVSRECSANELSIRVRVYTSDETRNVHFPTFLADCVMGSC